MNKLTLLITGERESGKTSLAKYILCEYLNNKIGTPRFTLEKHGKHLELIDSFNNSDPVELDYPNEHGQDILNTYSCKIYNFQDSVKRICINVLGLDPLQCYGSTSDKNSGTHLCWDDFSVEVREKHSKRRRGSGELKPASGFMNACEVIEVLQNDIFEIIDPTCWGRALYNLIEDEGFELAIIDGATTSNQITIGTEKGYSAIRLTRQGKNSTHQTADVPFGEYSLVIDNGQLNMAETHKKAKKFISGLFYDKFRF